MLKRIALLIGLIGGVAPACATNLCLNGEAVVFSFQERKQKKWMSLCKEAESKYLVYRFGTKANTELQYPSKLDGRSWEKFDFSGRRRGGGKANAGFGDYSLSFANGSTEYVVYQEWNDEENIYSIGITVLAGKRTITLSGAKTTQQGSLVLLEAENTNIRNSADE